jgi:hypothetical protein
MSLYTFFLETDSNLSLIVLSFFTKLSQTLHTIPRGIQIRFNDINKPLTGISHLNTTQQTT